LDDLFQVNLSWNEGLELAFDEFDLAEYRKDLERSHPDDPLYEYFPDYDS
jgi:hypothetical protein